MPTLFHIFYLLSLCFWFSCAPQVDPRAGIWRITEQCFGTPPVCADLVKQETESFWNFESDSKLLINNLPCSYSLLGENLKIECHSREEEILQIQKWTESELELFDEKKVEIFRFQREKKGF